MTFEGIIYKITGVCGNVYIGSTTRYDKRQVRHNTKKNTSCSKKLKKPLQFEIIRTDEYKLIKTMYLIEQYYIDIHKCINMRRAYTNPFIRERYRKEYYKKNKESIKEKYQKNKDSICKKQRDIYQNNKEANAKREREKYYKNKIQVNCPYCNKQSTNKNLKRHQQSKLCLEAQATKQININITINL